ncbi:MAG TPA: GrdX protein [Firmicutes bacterium]|nr:GrdX protein [Bacillota bacterium]
MRRKVMVITNNEAVNLQKQDQFIKGTLPEVLIHCRDLIQQGHRLISHPLAGSVKPNETPYKSVLLSAAKEKQVDLQSLNIIEAALHTAENMLRGRPLPAYSEKILAEFRFIDNDLLQAALRTV